MKKCNKKIKAPKYAFGAKEISGLAQTGGNIAQGFNTGNQTANAVFSGIDAVGDVASAINPIAGMAVKGVAGLGKIITGIVGTKGSVDPVTGEITKGTGIRGRRNRKKLIQQSGIVKNNIAAAENSQQLAADYYQENGNNIISVVADGGIIPNTLAYLDDGELIRTPDGSINEIPEEGKPEDSNLMNVPVGTQVLSDKIKVPGTNKTFAQKGKEIMKTNKYKGKDKYAENSKMLNDRNAQIAYDNLLALQESIKDGKQTKQKVNKYDVGTEGITDNRNAFVRFKDNMQSYILNDTRKRYLNKPDSSIEIFNGKIVKPKQNALQYNRPQYYAERDTSLFNDGAAINSGLMRAGWSYGNNTEYNLDYLPELDFSFMNKKSKNKTVASKKQTNTDDSKQTATPKFKPIVNTTPSFAKSMPDMGKISDTQKQNWYNAAKAIKPNNDNDKSFNLSEFVDSLVGASAGLIGPIANMTAKRGETNIPYTYTPKYGPTEWNIDPQLREINRSNAIARYNQSRLSPNTGAGLAFGIQSAIARNDAIARAYAEKNNMENQMAMANAGIYNDAARYNTQAMHTAAIENAQDRAAVDTARRQGLSQLGTALQTMSKDRRLNKRDQAVLAAMEPFLQYGMTGEQYQKLISLLG